MAVFTERHAIRQRMQEIKEERRELNSEYYQLLDRLHALDAEEKEAVDVDSVIGSLTEAVRVLKSLQPNIPTEVFIQHVTDLVKTEHTIIEEDEIAEVAPQHLIHHQQHLDATKNLTEPERKVGRVRSIEIDQMIIDYLKEVGVPVKLGKIKSAIEQKTGQEFRDGTFHNRLSNLMIKSSRVTKPTRGYYQYNFN